MAKAPIEYNTVKMDDDRIVDFPKRSNLLKTLVLENDCAKVRFDFSNGETRLFTVPASLLLQFAAHGASQKIGDETSGLADVGDMVLAVDSLTDRLNAGEWGAKRSSSGLAGTSVLARAVAEATGKAPLEVREWLSKKTQAEKIALRQNPTIAPIVARLEAAKAKPKNAIDTDGLLGELSLSAELSEAAEADEEE